MKLNRNAAGWADVAEKLRARVMREEWPAADLQCAVCDLAALFAEVDRLTAQLAIAEARNKGWREAWNKRVAEDAEAAEHDRADLESRRTLGGEP